MVKRLVTKGARGRALSFRAVAGVQKRESVGGVFGRQTS